MTIVVRTRAEGKATAECRVCAGPVSTFVAYNHDNGIQTTEVLAENERASLAAHHEEIAALRAENEKKAAALRSILHRFRHASECQWYNEARRALGEAAP